MFGIPSIPVTHLEGVDLNLLPPLAALLEERHVTRAAERSGLSQPAMSRALARLRQLLDDQLLIRDASGYVLTPRAERIQRQLAGLMPQLETLVADAVFDDMVHGRLDLSFYVASPPAALRQELLFDDVCVCVMSADHPLAKRKRLTLDEYARCFHLVIDIIDGEQPLIADRLRELGVQRRAALTLPLNVGARAAIPD